MTRTIKLVATMSIFAVAARLVLVNQQYIDHWSWRQSDVATIARNFSENGFPFAYPQISWRGSHCHFIGAAYQIADRRHRCAALVPGVAKMGLEFSETTRPLVFRRNYALAFARVVLARASDCREILSASFLRRGRNPDRKFWMVLEHRATNRNIEPHPGPRHNRDHRFVRRATPEICIA